MCGRFALTNPKFEKIEAVLGTSFGVVRPRFNISPSQNIPAIRQAGTGGYELDEMHWGLVPHWAKEPKTEFSTFNARMETAETKPAFRDSFKHKRCLIPASGFYEWKTEGKHKTPYYFTDDKGEGLTFAGLWDMWRGGNESLLSCTILVGPPNDLLARVHDRMPLILSEGAYALWLNPAARIEAIRDLLKPYPPERMKGWPVSSAVGNPRNDSPSLTDPI